MNLHLLCIYAVLSVLRYYVLFCVVFCSILVIRFVEIVLCFVCVFLTIRVVCVIFFVCMCSYSVILWVL